MQNNFLWIIFIQLIEIAIIDIIFTQFHSFLIDTPIPIVVAHKYLPSFYSIHRKMVEMFAIDHFQLYILLIDNTNQRMVHMLAHMKLK